MRIMSFQYYKKIMLCCMYLLESILIFTHNIHFHDKIRKFFKISLNNFLDHYENAPIQIYLKFHQQKLKVFRFLFLLKT